MATSPRPVERERTTSLLPSPTSRSSSSGSSSSSSNNGVLHSLSSPRSSPAQPQPHLPITRSEPNNPYPTTFVQADTTSFKQVVQMLTGSADTVSSSKPSNPIPPIKPQTKSKPSKLYERRNSLKNLKINPLIPKGNGNGNGNGNFHCPGGEILSPSLLDFPALVLSPVTPLIPDPFNRSPRVVVDEKAEEKAIKEKGFFLHPSPANTPRDSEAPRLLPLFPVTSPRVSGSDPTS